MSSDPTDIVAQSAHIIGLFCHRFGVACWVQDERRDVGGVVNSRMMRRGKISLLSHALTGKSTFRVPLDLYWMYGI